MKGKLVILDAVEKVPDKACDLVLLCTVLHEIENTDGMIKEIKRILSSDGNLAIIEFHKTDTPMGPSITRRISEGETKKLFIGSGFTVCDSVALGNNFYYVSFKQ